MKSPLDEIFKSLGSLKEELNIQNKVTVKKRNLEKVKRFLLERKTLLKEEVIPQEKEEVIPQGKESDEVNFNSKFKIKNKFVQLSKEDLADLSNEIITLINNAYKNIGGHFELKEPNDLLNTDLTYWIGNDSDQDPYSDSVIGGKETKFGTKLTTVGQDGQMQSKADVLQKLRNLLSRKGFYIEGDSFILSRVGLPPITDEETIKNVIGKNNIVFNSDGSYERSINGNLSTKFLIGIPKYIPKTPLDELFNSFNNLKKELNEQNKVNVKKRNIEKVNQFLKKKKTLLNENYNANIIDDVFIETPELNEIGTKEDYNNYLSSVFNGESDLFYRGDVDGLEKFRYSESEKYKFGSGIYFTTNKPYAILYAKDIPSGKVYKCLVDISNKIEFPNQHSVFKYINNYFNMGNVFPSGVYINSFTKEQQKEGKVIYIKNYNGHDELVVGSNDKVLILGSNKDKEMFKNYMNNNQ